MHTHPDPRSDLASAPCADAEALRLVALDAEDLAVVSAHMQDAVVRVGDIAYLPQNRRFALVGARFDWCASAQSGRVERARTGLHFECVTRAACTGIDCKQRDLVLNILNISFEPSDAPAGRVLITFSGGAAVRLDVECLEAQLRDLGERWKARAAPNHPLDEPAPDAARPTSG
ncbi:MAG TPA: DUF2948 family protein [Beijerinckiaceae bacterium]|jgi:hypothetical protein